MSSSSAAVKKFDGKVFHVHCDNTPQDSEIELEMSEGGDDANWGYCSPDVFLVISSAELMTSIQDQLRKHLTSTYKAESVTLQLADANGERGSQMVSSNLASRLITFVNYFRNRALHFFKENGLDGSNVRDANADITPTQAGVRLYPKLPQVKGNDEATKAKVRELAVKYGAIPEDDESEPRDVSDLDVTIKINIFGAYNNKFYMNYRLVAPFRHKDKPEILAEQPKKSRKRPATASSSSDAPAKKARAPAQKKDIDPSKYTTEDALAMAYVKSGIPLRVAAKMAMEHFDAENMEETEGEATATVFTQVSRAGGGAGAGSAAHEDEDA